MSTLFKALPMHPFSADKRCKIDGSDITNTDVLFKTMSSMMDDGEKQSTAYFYDRLVYQKVSLCTIISKNNIDLWNVTNRSTGKQSVRTSVFNKMRSACGQRSDLANEILNYENGIPQSLCTGLDSMYHRTKADIAKRLPAFHISSLHDKECQSAILDFFHFFEVNKYIFSCQVLRF